MGEQVRVHTLSRVLLLYRLLYRLLLRCCVCWAGAEETRQFVDAAC